MPPISWTSKRRTPIVALERLAHGGVRLEDQVVERLAVLEALLELGRLRAQLVVGELLEVGLERADVRGLFGEPLDAAPLAYAKDALELAERLVVDTGLGYRLASAIEPCQAATGPSQIVHRTVTAAPLASALVEATALRDITLFAGFDARRSAGGSGKRAGSSRSMREPR